MWRNTSVVTWAFSLGLVGSFWVVSCSLKATGILWDRNGDYEFCSTILFFPNIFKSQYHLSSNSHSGTGMSGWLCVKKKKEKRIKKLTHNFSGVMTNFMKLSYQNTEFKKLFNLHRKSVLLWHIRRLKSCKGPRDPIKITLIQGEVHPDPHWTAAG